MNQSIFYYSKSVPGGKKNAYIDGLWKLSKAAKNRFVSNLRGGGERSVLTSHVTNDRVSIQIGRAFFNHFAQWADILQKSEIVDLS